MSKIIIMASAWETLRNRVVSRPFQDGESLTFVAFVEKRWGDPGQPTSLSLLCKDGRVFECSRLWGTRKAGETFIDASESGIDEVETRCHELPIRLEDKMAQYLQKCGSQDASFTGCISDPQELKAVLRKQECGDSVTAGYRHWYWLESIKVSKPTPVAEPSAEQSDRVTRFLTGLGLKPEDFESAIGAWAAILG